MSRGFRTQFALASVIIIALCLGFLCIHIFSELARIEYNQKKLEKIVHLHSNGRLQTHFQQQAAYPELLQSNHIPQTTSNDVDADNHIIIYNRVPKTGSTSFVGLAYDLCSHNHFHVIHLNTTKNAHYLSIADQMALVHNITKWDAVKPVLYHGHMAFLPFQKFGLAQTPIYLNIVRDPLDRLVSYYYFLRYGDDFRPHLRRRRANNRENFDDCVSRGGRDCAPERLWLQIPFFCGQSSLCWQPGNRWALEEAKRNLLLHYFLVGITEQLSDFISVLEISLPRFFHGATDRFSKGGKSHLRQTKIKQPPSSESLDVFHRSPIWRAENEFYEFAKQQFLFTKQRLFSSDRNGTVTRLVGQFRYEKIRPRTIQATDQITTLEQDFTNR